MTETFGSEYARDYDLLYKDKHYLEESRLLHHLLQHEGDGIIRRVLDLGCGTGNYAFPLAQQGYDVVGVDCSAGMLESAKRKATEWQGGGKVGFYLGDIRNFQCEESFDAALMMFAVLGYQSANADVLAALRTARKHMRTGGLLLFDVWYGPAVLSQRPSERIKAVATEGGQLLRVASAKLEIERHLCEVSYRLWRIEGERLVGQSEEVHLMRYFFPLELDLFLECSGFTRLRLGAFPEFEREPDTATWNVLGLARAA